MAGLVGLSFAQTFDFSRPIAADYRDPSGAIVTAAIDEARFDHNEAGARRGLLIETGPVPGQHDAITVKPGDWEVSGQATVLVEWEGPTGIERRGLYSNDCRATVNAAIGVVGHLRSLIVLPGFLPNMGGNGQPGFVWYRNVSYPLGAAIGDGAGGILADDEGRLIIESA